MRAGVLASVAAAIALGANVQLRVPPVGDGGAVTGFVEPDPGMQPRDWKLAVLTSADGGATWWDKSHGPYLNAAKRSGDPQAIANAAQLQNAGVVIQADWSFRLEDFAGDYNDLNSPLWRAYLLPSTFDMSFPQYLIEGIPMRGDVMNAAVAVAEAVRGATQNQWQDNTGVVAPSPKPTPAASKSSTPSGSATATASPLLDALLQGRDTTSGAAPIVGSGVWSMLAAAVVAARLATGGCW